MVGELNAKYRISTSLYHSCVCLLSQSTCGLDLRSHIVELPHPTHPYNTINLSIQAEHIPTRWEESRWTLYTVSLQLVNIYQACRLNSKQWIDEAAMAGPTHNNAAAAAGTFNLLWLSRCPHLFTRGQYFTVFLGSLPKNAVGGPLRIM